MALVTWPSKAKITSSELYLQAAVVSEDSIYSLKRSVADFGGRKWRGQVTIAATDTLSEKDEIEVFIDQITDPENHFEVPVHRTPFDLGESNDVETTEVTFSGKIQVTGNYIQITLASAPGSGAANGQVARIGDRFYRVVNISGSDIMLTPGILPGSSDTKIIKSTLVKAVLAPSSGLSNVRSPSFSGPWVLSWDEFI